VAAKRIVRVPQPRYLLVIKGTLPAWNQAGWRGKPGSPSFWLLVLGDARTSNQLPVCHRQWSEMDLDHPLQIT
jgi:hypothetical protein